MQELTAARRNSLVFKKNTLDKRMNCMGLHILLNDNIALLGDDLGTQLWQLVKHVDSSLL